MKGIEPQIAQMNAEIGGETVVEEEYIHKELSGRIIGAAMKVLNTLKPGLDEKLYENALIIELQKSRGTKSSSRGVFPCTTKVSSLGRSFRI